VSGGVASSCDIFGRRTVLDTKHKLTDQISGVGADDVSAKDLVSFLVRNNFDKSVVVAVGSGTAVCLEREFSDGVVDSGLLELLFSLTDPSDLWPGVELKEWRCS